MKLHREQQHISRGGRRRRRHSASSSAGGFWTHYTSPSYLLRNKSLLFALLFLAIFNILYLCMNGQTDYLFIFIILAFLTLFFTRNMIVILAISLFMTNLLIFFNLVDCNCGGAKEGYTGGQEDGDNVSGGSGGGGDADAGGDAGGDAAGDAGGDAAGDGDGDGDGIESMTKLLTTPVARAASAGKENFEDDFQKFDELNQTLIEEIRTTIMPKLTKMENIIQQYERAITAGN